jgi:uncharacterized membrane protein
MHRSTAISLTTLLGLIGTAIPAAAATAPPVSLSYSSVDYPGATSTTIYGANRYQVGHNQYASFVGKYTDSAGNTHGFLLSGGNFTSLDDPNGFGTIAYGISNHGQIVGTYVTDASGGARLDPAPTRSCGLRARSRLSLRVNLCSAQASTTPGPSLDSRAMTRAGESRVS